MQIALQEILFLCKSVQMNFWSKNITQTTGYSHVRDSVLYNSTAIVAEDDIESDNAAV